MSGDQSQDKCTFSEQSDNFRNQLAQIFANQPEDGSNDKGVRKSIEEESPAHLKSLNGGRLRANYSNQESESMKLMSGAVEGAGNSPGKNNDGNMMAVCDISTEKFSVMKMSNKSRQRIDMANSMNPSNDYKSQSLSNLHSNQKKS